MPDDLPQLYLITPAVLDLDRFPQQLGACLDATEIGCVRLSLASREKITSPVPPTPCGT